MGKLRFSDGMSFDTSGKLRPERRSDGWYVVGKGMLLPVASHAEAQDLIKRLTIQEEKDDTPRT
jgi:hypothetical protein